MSRPKSLSNRALDAFVRSKLAETYLSLVRPGLFADVTQFCLFIGHGRSGSSLVGALLNAHPNVIMSNELDALAKTREGLTCRQLFNLIYFTSLRQARRGSRGGGGYAYAVPNQWQGRSQHLQLLGDRKAGATAIHLYRDPTLVDEFQKIVRIPVIFVSIVRNPFDTLATTTQKTERYRNESLESHLERQIVYYFQRTSAIQELSKRYGDELIRFVHHDMLISRPESELTELCRFLRIQAEPSYIKNCASIVRPTPHITRDQIAWSERCVDMVYHGIEAVPWLRNYTFES